MKKIFDGRYLSEKALEVSANSDIRVEWKDGKWHIDSMGSFNSYEELSELFEELGRLSEEIEEEADKPNRQDLIKEYGKLLRWNNGGGHESGNTWPYTFYIDNLVTGEQVKVTDKAALAYIKKQTVNNFRNNKIYECHVELFNILGIEPRKSFRSLLESKKISGYKLAKLTGIPQPTISMWVSGHNNFRNSTMDNSIKVAKALGMTVEQLNEELEG